MPWKYCYNCEREVDKPSIEEFQDGNYPLCACGVDIEYDKEDAIIDTLTELKSEIEDLKGFANKVLHQNE